MTLTLSGRFDVKKSINETVKKPPTEIYWSDLFPESEIIHTRFPIKTLAIITLKKVKQCY